MHFLTYTTGRILGYVGPWFSPALETAIKFERQVHVSVSHFCFCSRNYSSIITIYTLRFDFRNRFRQRKEVLSTFNLLNYKVMGMNELVDRFLINLVVRTDHSS